MIFSVRTQTADDVDAAVAARRSRLHHLAGGAAPVRGQLVKRWGELLTEHKADLATLVTAEVGKITLRGPR